MLGKALSQEQFSLLEAWDFLQESAAPSSGPLRILTGCLDLLLLQAVSTLSSASWLLLYLFQWCVSDFL